MMTLLMFTNEQPNMAQQTLQLLITQIDNALPQTQCEQCGFKGCLPYATALAKGDTQINRCPPGGDPVIKELAQILKLSVIPLDSSCGVPVAPQVMIIDEPLCIGCTKCIQACPVDAIIGAKKRMHTIIEAECTGCALCIPVCPLDCILIKPIDQPVDTNQIGLTQAQKLRADKSRSRFNARKLRYAQQQRLTETVLPKKMILAPRTTTNIMLNMIALAKNKAENRQVQNPSNLGG